MKTIKFKENHEVRKGIIFLIFALLCNLGVSAQTTFTIGNLKYTTTTDSTVSVGKNETPTGELVIPASVEYEGTQYSVTSIGNQAFYWCTDITSITIPYSVMAIGSGAFSGCSSLNSVTINSNAILSKTYSSSNSLKAVFGEQVKKYQIGNNVEKIGTYAFYGCTGITTINIGSAVTTIESGAFSGCSSLNSVTINSNAILSKTYSSSNSLKAVFGEQVKEYQISNGVEKIGAHTFYGCTGLTSITIPNSVITIGAYAFYGCSGLTHVNIGNSVTNFPSTAFYNCKGLTEINVDENNSVYSSKSGVVYNKSQTELVRYPEGRQGAYNIPNSVTSIGDSAFYYCRGLTAVNIPNSVTNIGNWAFYYSRGLTAVNIGNSVTNIGNHAFDRCIDLTFIDIPNSVTNIGENAFSGCTGLTSANIGNSVTSIGKDAFSSSALTEINVDENNATYSSIDGVLFNKSQTELLQYPQGKQGTYTIPNSVTSIGERAFSGCTGLTSVTIPNSVTSIGREAFRSCAGLTSIDIPNSVTSIGNFAFSYCSGLTSVTIPNSVTKIGDYAFWYCKKLTDIYCHIEEPLTIYSHTFENVPTNTCTLHVPIGSKEKYEVADVWKVFLNIVEDLPTGIVSIDNSQLAIDNGVWHTLNGVRLNGKPTKAGVYIVNGRAVVIK